MDLKKAKEKEKGQFEAGMKNFQPSQSNNAAKFTKPNKTGHY